MSLYAAEVIEDPARLAALEPDWWVLWRSCGATPFSSPAWLLPWWDAFAPGRLVAVAVRSGPRLVALAPIYLETGPRGRRLLPLGIGVSDLTDVLVDPAEPGAPDVLVGAVAGMAGWDSWELEELPLDASALRVPVPPGCKNSVADQSACPVLALPGEADDPLRAVPARQRRKIRMARHRAERRGGRVIEVPARGCDEFLAALADLHGARWAERGEAGVLADEPVRRFHADALPRLLAAGLARPTTLEIEGRVVGAYYGLRDRRAAYAYLGGFDPDFAFESPGTVLLAEAIEAAGRDGAREVNLLRGREPYKYAWGAQDRWNRRRSFRRQAVR